MHRDRKTVGILGGMGPMATVDFYGKIVQETPATTDQEHIKVVMWSDPEVPDRTAAVLDGGPDPFPWLVRGIVRLESLGAHLVAVPCNLAHVFLDRVRELVTVPVLDMIDETGFVLEAMFPNGGSIALLASTGTIRSNLYQERLRPLGINVEVPDDDEQQNLVMQTIRSIKAGDVSTDTVTQLIEACNPLFRRGVDAVVAGCTELPLVLGTADIGVPIVDPTRILARAVVAHALSCRSSLPLRASQPPAPLISR